ncbi:cuticle protein 19.8-like [Anopheles stephensi]|uniref:Uncharacterized protein n=1 Tax=Anopheles stephensi TaxID=30069 RepID=A0A182Y2A7_ANOST|nr:cuticle protein 19.8-like [Anopheles stephensi]
MKLFVVVSSLLAVATAAPSATLYAAYGQPALYAAGGAPLATYVAAGPAELYSQYHAQDELGQYSYGYNGGLSAKAESKSFDGVTRGSYSYLDAENKLQTVAYTADALNGFRVAASNLPVAPVETRTAPEPVQDTPEVAAAKADHMAAIEAAKLRNAAAEKESESEATAIIAAAPATFAAAPAALPVAAYAAPAPASFAYSTQSIAQPIAAYATYAAAPAPAAIELKAPASFAYSTYTQSAPLAYTQYAAAPYAALPIAQYAYPAAPAAPIAFAARSQPVDIAAELPEPVKDTPEVAKAKEEHLQAVAEAKARSLQ